MDEAIDKIKNVRHGLVVIQSLVDDDSEEWQVAETSRIESEQAIIELERPT